MTVNLSDVPELSSSQRVLIVEDDEQLGEPVAAYLESWGNRPQRLTRPDDAALSDVLDHGDRREPDVDAIAVVSRDDVVALRYALLAEHLRPGVRLVVTIFDRTTAGEIARRVPNCTVLAMTDAIVPNLLAACLGDHFCSVLRRDERLLAVTQDGRLTAFEPEPKRSRGWPIRWRTLDTSARALVVGFLGILTALVAEAVLGVVVLHEHWYDAIWQSARVLTTIGTSPRADAGPAWYKLLSATIMVAVLALAGLFTASLVDRVTGRRLTGIIGARAIPVRDHVIVVGLGQVGLRLCVRLRELGIRVVAVEQDEDARCVSLARQLSIPVVLGRGGDKFLLRRVGIEDARAVAAVSSVAPDNIAVAVTARALAPDQNIVLRAGGADDVVNESRSLFRIGAVCDVPRIVGAMVACYAVGVVAPDVYCTPDGRAHAVLRDGTVVRLDGREEQLEDERPDEPTVASRS